MEDCHYRIVSLVRKYLCGEILPGEAAELEAREKCNPGIQRLRMGFRVEELDKRMSFSRTLDTARAFRKFEKRISAPKRLFSLARIGRYAAIFILPLLLSVWVYRISVQHPSDRQETTDLILPGGYRAVLTLSDGRALPLGENTGKVLPVSGGLSVTNTGKALIYNDTAAPALASIYNRLSTPRGGEYELTLSDGSRVYLNAATEVRYPVRFNSSVREVYLSGEAYFEITPDPARPFYVVTDAARIRVYGTTFNVNTHLRHRMQTLLVSGQIGITGQREAKEYVLHPAELAEFTSDGILTKMQQVDTTPYIAWRSGKFVFENQFLEEIMDNLALWYDAEIFYVHPHLKTMRFTAHLRRYEKIDVILGAIHRITGITFRIQGKTILVME